VSESFHILWHILMTVVIVTRAPPEHGLATERMSGKKKDKFRTTVGFACNADSSEKMPPFYIGKAGKPICFERHSPNNYGFYY